MAKSIGFISNANRRALIGIQSLPDYAPMSRQYSATALAELG